MRLDKYLSKLGYGKSENTKKIIKEGKVCVDNKIVTSPSFIIKDNMSVIIDPSVSLYKKMIYVMMNKPEGYICATKDDFYPTVLDLLDSELKKENLFPVGRLDIDTTGLLLLTNDSHFMKKMTLPENHIRKEYLVRFGGKIKNTSFGEFSEGIVLSNGYKTAPSEVKILSSDELIITIYEGKYHEIKKMFEALGLKVVSLKRISMGEFVLDESLKEGKYKQIEIKKKFSIG